MNCIVAVDRSWGIGMNGKLLVSIPEDLRNFRKLTTGKTVILGRKTLATFPKGAPLANRRNIILTKDETLAIPGAETAHSVEEALALVADEKGEDVFVIGGESVYRAFLPHCDRAYVTKIDYTYAADTFFPDLDADPAWVLSEEGEERTCFDLEYAFCIYSRISS